MTQQTEEYEKTRAYICDFLCIPEGLEKADVELDLGNLPFTPDLLLKKADVVYVVEIRSKVTIDVIARLNLLRASGYGTNQQKRYSWSLLLNSFLNWNRT